LFAISNKDLKPPSLHYLIFDHLNPLASGWGVYYPAVGKCSAAILDKDRYCRNIYMSRSANDVLDS